MSAAFEQYIAEGATHLCRTWAVTRRDGTVFGFTDHDQDLSFDGITFRAGTGLTASALQQTTGLSVNNTEALGALSADAISEADINAGRFDGAEVVAWLVRWDDVAMRRVEFRGAIGALTRQGAAFNAELRGLTEALNVPGGRIFHRLCPAVLGDQDCGVQLDPDFTMSGTVSNVGTMGELTITDVSHKPDGWFARGAVSVLSGAAEGLRGIIKTDAARGQDRIITLWTPLGADLAVGDQIKLQAGCDKQFATCRDKFSNAASFRGFPHIPGEDWLMSVPRSSDVNDGGSLSS